jgi:hypothetical protein
MNREVYPRFHTLSKRFRDRLRAFSLTGIVRDDSGGISVAGGQGFGVAYQLDGATHNNPYDN